MIGPTLPPGFKRPAEEDAAPPSPKRVAATTKEKGPIGPTLPPQLEKRHTPEADDKEEEADSEEDVIGPLPPTNNTSLRDQIKAKKEEEAAALEHTLSLIEQRASTGSAIGPQLPGKKKVEAREEWMMVPPSDKSTSVSSTPLFHTTDNDQELTRTLAAFLTKARTFRATAKEEVDSSGWTAVGGKATKQSASAKPKDKAQLFAVSGMDTKEADAVKAARSQEKALLEEHRRKQLDARAESKKEESHRPFFDREKDMLSTGMSVGAVKRTIANASQLNDRFASGRS